MNNIQLIINVLSPICFEEIFSDFNLKIYQSHHFRSGSERWKFDDILTIGTKF
jgi:hypothetical protein